MPVSLESTITPGARARLEKSRKGADECWPWVGHITRDGYGRVDTGRSGTEKMAHRVAWTELVGPIPPGVELDHLCHTNDPTCFAGWDCPHRRCVNPAHLEVVGKPENCRRQHHRTGHGTHCKQDHLMDEGNTYRAPNGRIYCRTCITAGRARRRLRRPAGARG